MCKVTLRPLHPAHAFWNGKVRQIGTRRGMIFFTTYAPELRREPITAGSLAISGINYPLLALTVPIRLCQPGYAYTASMRRESVY